MEGHSGLAGGGAAVNIGLVDASNFAPVVDQIMICLLLLSLGILVLVFGLILVFTVKYRADSPVKRGDIAQRTWRFEIAWTSATILAFFALFYWGARVYLQEYQPPSGAMKIYIVGKRWMWKVEYPGGQREIDALHVPVGQKVQLILTSEDVIHDLAIPAFRLRHDVLPDRYETFWFIADRPGTYDMLCTQLCGAEHSRMRGHVIAMPPTDFQRWLEQNGASGTLVAAGKQLFSAYGCSGCHDRNDGTVRAPPLTGVYGSLVALADGRTVMADDQYLRDCILFPSKQLVAGYPPDMPSFSGKIGEGDLERLIAYIKSLGPESRL
jgi:cytochrome c oxidase subunit II